MANNYNMTVTGEFWAAFLCFMAFCVMLMYRNNSKKDRCVRNMLFICTVLELSDILTRVFDGRPGGGVKILLYASNYVLYMCCYMVIAVFIMYMWLMVKRNNEKIPSLFKIVWIGVALFALILTVGSFFDLYFYIDGSNVYHRTDAYIYSQLITVLGVAAIIWATIKYKNRMSRFEIISSCSYCILPPLGTLIQAGHYGVAVQQVAIAIATLTTFYVREADVRDELEEQDAELAESNEIIRDAGFGIWRFILDQSGHVCGLTGNEMFRTIYGMEEAQSDPKECLSFFLDRLINKEDDPTIYDYSNAVPGVVVRFTFPWEHPQKGRIFVETAGTMHISRDGQIQFSGYVADVTTSVQEDQEQKERLREAKAEAEAANQAKTSFLFNMSHDIRTPMNAIMGFRDLLEKNQEDPEKRADYLAKIGDASNILLSIINNVLEMARIERGALEIEETACSSEDYNDSIFNVFSEMMEQKGLRFTRQMNVQHPYVFCDTIKLREVLINILSNAYKYTNPGGSVDMRLDEIPSDREGWALYRTTISDTGIGMDEDFLPHILEEFARESNTTEAKIEGTGLGMPIVKNLVEMMHGTIEVRSKKGEGSTFIVTIPHRIADRSDFSDPDKVEYDPASFEGKRILLAEDNDLNAEIAQEILSSVGISVERAEDGKVVCEMLEKAESSYYELILMDIQMPNMNGYEATECIRNFSDPEKAGIPIIAMTANAFEEDRKNALASGMNGHLAKPIDVKALFSELARNLKASGK